MIGMRGHVQTLQRLMMANYYFMPAGLTQRNLGGKRMKCVTHEEYKAHCQNDMLHNFAI
jgi:hypothetical protein